MEEQEISNFKVQVLDSLEDRLTQHLLRWKIWRTFSELNTFQAFNILQLIVTSKPSLSYKPTTAKKASNI